MLENTKNKERGFTLLEVIAAIVILSVILLIAIPGVSGLLNNFRNEYYKKLQETVKTSGKDYINDHRSLRPGGIFYSRVIPISALENENKLDTVIDYKKNKCSSDSYVVVVKTAEKKYSYESCLICPGDDYRTEIDKYPYCHVAWKDNDNVFERLSTPPENVYIPINSSYDYIREQLGLTKEIVKQDADGNVIATYRVPDSEIFLPLNINSFLGHTATSGVAYYEDFGGGAVQTNVHIFQNEAPKITISNLKNGASYTPGTWTSGVRVVLGANDEYFDILGLKISEYQYYDVDTASWNKITSCASGTTSCTVTYSSSMNKTYKYRMIVQGGSMSKVSDAFNFKIDASPPTCNINMLDASNNNYTSDTFINTSQVRIRYTAEDPYLDGYPLSSMDKVELYILNQNPLEPVVTQNLNNNVTTWTNIGSVTDEGTHSILLRCYDSVGNYSSATATIKILRDINVNFYSPNNTTLYQTSIYQYNQAMGTLPTPNRTGHTFLGWYDAPTGGTRVTNATVLNTTSKIYNLFSRWQANVYTLTYDSNGGTNVSNPTSYTYGVGVASFNNPTRTGYNFAGWKAGTVIKTNITTTDLGNMHLVAQWSPVTYIIQYNAGTGSGSMTSTVCTYNVNCTLRANGFSKTGNSFTGWSLTPAGAIAYADKATVLNLAASQNATVTLYALWGKNNYTITYNLVGGTNHANNPSYYTFGDTVNFANPTRTGYRFDGWYKESSYTNAITGISSTTTGSVTVYAKWIANQYHIDYAANGGTGTMARTTCTYDTGCTLRTNTFTRNLFRFTNWTYGGSSYSDGATVSNLTATHNAVVVMNANWVQRVRFIYVIQSYSGQTSNAYGFSVYHRVNLTASTPYYMESSGYVSQDAFNADYNLAVYLYPADWSWSTRNMVYGIAPTKYGGTYFTAPGTQEYLIRGYMFPSGGSRAGTATWSATSLYRDTAFQQNSIWKEVDNNTSITIPTVEAGRPGYQFTGWLGEKGTTYQAGNTVVMNASLANTDLKSRFRAQWAGNTYYVKYNNNTGTGTMTQTTCTFGSSCTLRSNTMSKTGYTFAGWATSASGAVAYGNGATVSNLTETQGGSVNLYAKWTARTYTIAFNGNGHTSGSTANKSCTYDANCALTSNGFAKTGYTFAGWAKTASGAVAYSNGATVKNLAASGTVTLYAKWTARTYTIAFNGNGHTSGSTANKSCTYDANCALTSNGFAKTGYTFAGWAKTASGAVAYSNGATVKNLATSGTVTLYAKWTARTYTIAFNGNGHTSGSTANKSCTYGANCALTSNGFAKTGYTFAGWAKTASGAVAYSNGATVKNLATSGTVTLYAKWTARTYTIAFNGNGHTSGSTANKSCTYNANCVLTSNGFAKTGNSFAGWAKTSGGAVAYGNGATVKNLASSGTVTLYAKWTPNETSATIYSSKYSSCNRNIPFYTTKAANPSGWTIRSATYSWFSGGSVVSTYTGHPPSSWAGVWTTYNTTANHGWQVYRYSSLFIKVYGKVKGGGNIVKQSQEGGCG